MRVYKFLNEHLNLKSLGLLLGHELMTIFYHPCRVCKGPIPIVKNHHAPDFKQPIAHEEGQRVMKIGMSAIKINQIKEFLLAIPNELAQAPMIRVPMFLRVCMGCSLT
jgi:hypothetical protein